MDKNADFLQAAIKRICAKKWDVPAAQVGPQISIMIRIPPALRPHMLSTADQAVQVAREMHAEGWTLAGFSDNGDNLLIDLVHPRMD